MLLALVATGCAGPQAGSVPTATGGSSAVASSPGPEGAASAVPARADLYPCTGYGRLPTFNTVQTNAENIYGWAAFPPASVGDGAGDIDWAADPYGDAGWRLWLSSLRWLGPSIEAARSGDQAAFHVADSIIRDWRDDHVGGWGDDPDDAEANHHRLNVLLCFREVVAERSDGQVPEEYGWIDDLIAKHAEQAIRRYSRGNNHGSMENRALLGAGCVLGREDWGEEAMSRARQDIPAQVDAQGLSNEAAPHYAWFNYRLFRDIDDLADQCGVESGDFGARLDAMGVALPHMTDATGAFWQYGDSPERRLKAESRNSPELQYAATDGREGVAPVERVRAFAGGPVFGRSSWGTPEAGFADVASWTLRAGTGQEHKAHRGDLLQFLYTTRGRQIVEDGGHPGVVQDDWRPWGYGPTAHNTIHLPYAPSEFPGSGPAEVTRVLTSPDGSADGAGVAQPLPGGGERARDVLVLTGLDAAVVVDRTTFGAGDGRPVAETLWNLPAEFVAERTAPDTVRAVSEASGEATTLIQVRLDGRPVDDKGIELYRGHLATRGHLHRGFHYPDEQQREEAAQVAFHAEGREVGIVSVLIPGPAGEDAAVEAQRADGGPLTLTIHGSGGSARVQVGDDGTVTRLD